MTASTDAESDKPALIFTTQPSDGESVMSYEISVPTKGRAAFAEECGFDLDDVEHCSFSAYAEYNPARGKIEPNYGFEKGIEADIERAVFIEFHGAAAVEIKADYDRRQATAYAQQIEADPIAAVTKAATAHEWPESFTEDHDDFSPEGPRHAVNFYQDDEQGRVAALYAIEIGRPQTEPLASVEFKEGEWKADISTQIKDGQRKLAQHLCAHGELIQKFDAIAADA